jgi:hypothetical protein
MMIRCVTGEKVRSEALDSSGRNSRPESQQVYRFQDGKGGI